MGGILVELYPPSGTMLRFLEARAGDTPQAHYLGRTTTRSARPARAVQGNCASSSQFGGLCQAPPLRTAAEILGVARSNGSGDEEGPATTVRPIGCRLRRWSPPRLRIHRHRAFVAGRATTIAIYGRRYNVQ